MKPKGRLLPLLLATAALLALPASGKGAAEVHLAGSHGYRLAISASSEDVTVTAKKGGASVAYYLFGSRLEGDRIDARLPGVGGISLRFHEHRRFRRGPQNDCRSPHTLIRKGVFVGWIRIRGERDYTRAESHHVRGKIVRRAGGKCGQRPSARASSARSEWLGAGVARGRSGNLSFMAISLPMTKSRTNLVFAASLTRVRGEMVVVSSQSAISEDAAAMEFGEPPRSATVTPPSPFTGTATFQQESADQFSWTGDLTVELPGSGEVSLAGPRFETALCLEHSCRGDEQLAEIGKLLADFFS
ncbi:MAG: hypothetical protein ACTHNY_05950 [Solirubrobacterales bacterium]